MKEVPLFQKIYDFYKEFYQELDNLPKKSRAVLTIKIENTILELLEIISKISFISGEPKIEGLKYASIKTDLLKILFRLCFETKIINQKKYIFFEEKLQEIGRMVGGWRKGLITKTSAN